MNKTTKAENIDMFQLQVYYNHCKLITRMAQQTTQQNGLLTLDCNIEL